MSLFSDFEAVRRLEGQERGYQFEKLLNAIFTREGAKGSTAYSIIGEQLDGAVFEFGRTFLLEARWRAKKASAADLYVLQGKVKGKFDGTVGLFWSMSGFSEECLEQILIGKLLNVLLFDESDLLGIVKEEISFKELLEHKYRVAAEMGDIYYPWSTIKEVESLREQADRVVIVVEGATDVQLMRKIIKWGVEVRNWDPERPYVIAGGGKISMANMLATLKVPSKVRHVVAVLDRGRDSEREMERLIASIQDKMNDHSPNTTAQFFIASPDTKSWPADPTMFRQSNELRMFVEYLDGILK